MRTFLKILLGLFLSGVAAFLVLLAFIWPWSRLEFSPDGTFRRLVSPVIPPSVANISVDGYDTRYQSDVTITFEMAVEDRQKILSNGSWEKVPCEEGKGECYHSREQWGHGEYDLYFADDTKRVWFHYFSS